MNENNEIIEFYKYYPKDHWIYKLAMLKNILKNFEEVKKTIKLNLFEADDKEIITMIKAEIHFTYFQMVEALFQLIFTLETLNDKELWYYLSSHKWRKKFEKKNGKIYDRIKDVSDYKLAIFNKKIKLPDERIVPFIQYVLYYSTEVQISEAEMEENLKKIKDILVIFAKDFTDRADYNAYKHSLRFYQSKLTLTPFIPKTRVAIESYKADNVITYLEEDDDGKIWAVNKVYDYERDFMRANICHQLISTIIDTRINHFFKKGEEKVRVFCFHELKLEELHKTDDTLIGFKRTIGKVNWS